ncbi:MAG: carboxyl transferase domain-containing protein [Acidimicrobiia bacterium]
MDTSDFTSVLIANRGEISIRIARAAAEVGLRSVAVHPADDAASLHVRIADDAVELPGSGATAYLDIEAVIGAALGAGCGAVHPGYGFLSENASFARACAQRGLVFVGPEPETLELLGDKVAARALAARLDIPVLSGTDGPTSDEDAVDFMASLGGRPLIVKAVNGGGGRGMRVVRSIDALPDALARCRSEAAASFGNGDVYLETLIERARHVEVQIVGDGTGSVSHLGERDCSIQRRHQKVVEIAPAPGLDPDVRRSIHDAAVRMASDLWYRGVATFEFLVDVDTGAAVFIEANPRLQVEHTVTEEITGIDLVAAQFQLAQGHRLAELGLAQHDVSPGRGTAIQARINTETLLPDGSTKPSGGTISTWVAPGGPGVRCDSYLYPGYTTNPRYDSLVAKIVAHSSSASLADAATRLYRALSEVQLVGVDTNLTVLQNLVRMPEFVNGGATTTFLDDHIDELLTPRVHPQRHHGSDASATATGLAGLAGAKLDSRDPLAVLHHGKSAEPVARRARAAEAPDGAAVVRAPMQGTIVTVDVAVGDRVRSGQQLLVMEAMKMEHVVVADVAGVVQRIDVLPGDTVFESHVIAYLEIHEDDEDDDVLTAAVDLDAIRPDLCEVIDRHALTLDEQRPDAVARRRTTDQRTARENIDDLCDPDTYLEYGSLVVAAQRRRRTLDDLIHRTQADGMIAGIGSVNGRFFGDEASRCVLMSYDYTVLAGTQGAQNHRKKDRLFELAEQWRLPVVFFTEGGGGRPGDTDGIGGSGLDCWAFNYFAKLSGLVPLVGINSGRCFAGNAAILGCCDVVIATENSNIGMGGPAMIEGGGLGVFRPDEVGPMDVQVPNGVVDIAVEDEAAAVLAAKHYLSFFQGPIAEWSCPDQRLLRHTIPENRLRVYDIRTVIDTLADDGSVLELRRGFGRGMVTSLIRVEGRPLGLIANNPAHLGGAIDSDGADKAARFMQLCDAFDVPLLFLCDTPGMMVGPEVERTALVRHCSRLFVTGANLTVPFFTIVLRKGYGLGAQAMAGGSFKAPFFTVAWPTGEFGGMGLEGAVKLGYRNELAAIDDPDERTALFEQMVARMYEHGKALSSASYFEIDDVIDPADSRFWISRALRSVPPAPPRTGKKRPSIDTW